MGKCGCGLGNAKHKSIVIKNQSMFHKSGGFVELERCRKSTHQFHDICSKYPVEFEIKNHQIAHYSANIRLSKAEKKQIVNKWDDAVNYD
jgi:hypothetical protein